MVRHKQHNPKRKVEQLWLGLAPWFLEQDTPSTAGLARAPKRQRVAIEAAELTPQRLGALSVIAELVFATAGQHLDHDRDMAGVQGPITLRRPSAAAGQEVLQLGWQSDDVQHQVCMQARSAAAAQALLDLCHSGKLGACLTLIPDAAKLSTRPCTSLHQQLYVPSVMADDALLALGEDVLLPPTVAGQGAGYECAGYECAGADSHASSSMSAHDMMPARHLSLLAASAAPGLLPGAASSSAAAQPLPGMSVWQLCLGILPAALSSGTAATYAEDPARRPWQSQLLSVLSWLAPHWGCADRSSSNSMSSSSGTDTPIQQQQPLQQQHDIKQKRLAKRPSSRQQQVAMECDMASAGPGTQHQQQPAPGVAFDAAELYGAVKPTQQEPQETRQPWQLRPVLRPYQRRAVHWMLQQERQEQDAEQALHPLWRRVLASPGGAALGDADGADGGAKGLPEGCQASFYLNPHSGLLSRQWFAAPSWPRGGILADEMGLGKTVELLACILLNRFDAGGKDSPNDNGSSATTVAAPHPAAAMPIAPASTHFSHTAGPSCAHCASHKHGQGTRRRGSAVCSHCMRARALQTVRHDCGATLIVVPASILPQWHSELLRHAAPGALRLLVYQGQWQQGQQALQGAAAAGASAGGVVTAAELAAADVVLTTYDVLRKDVAMQPELEVQERSLRRPKKHAVVPTPLTRLRWWRVVLDEAQMVGSGTAKAAEMALKLDTVHRWCVTGTPISRGGLEDLYGLLAFLKAEPWADRAWWRRAIAQPYESGSTAGRAQLLKLLRPADGGLMWRSAKRDVAAELGLPPQHHHLTIIKLSAVERHFYNRQHQDCATNACKALFAALPLSAQAVWGDDRRTDRQLTPPEQKKVLVPLLRLRQAAVHPQVGGSGLRSTGGAAGAAAAAVSGIGAGRAPMTMDEVLGVLWTKSLTEAEEAQRVLISALNGLAALMLIDGDKAGAVKTYRQALATAEANKATVRTDPLQLLHSTHNLAQLLAGLSKPGAGGGAPAGTALGIPRTLRDGQLEQEAAALKEAYLAQRQAGLAAALTTFKRTADSASPFAAPSPWWLAAVDCMEAAGMGDEVVGVLKERLRSDIGDQYKRKLDQNATSLGNRFNTLTGLKLLLTQELDAIETTRSAAMVRLAQLQDMCAAPTAALIEQAGACARCRTMQTGRLRHLCEHCKLDDHFVAWEARIFYLRTVALSADAEVTPEEALRQAQLATLHRIGRGGLHEEAGLSGNSAHSPASAAGTSSSDGAAAGRRLEAAVARTNIVRGPSEAERALRLLAHLVRGLGCDARVQEVVDAAGAHLERLEAQRKLLVDARSLSLAQRQLLYAHDELGMATMRIRLRVEGEQVAPHEAAFKLHEAEVVARNADLSNERAMADADLARALGTVRYLSTLRAARERQKAAQAQQQQQQQQQEAQIDVASSSSTAAADDASAASSSGRSAQTPTPAAPPSEVCPVCQEELGTQCVVLPCGHQLCFQCSDALSARIPPSTPLPHRRVACPSCRVRCHVSDIAFVDGSRGAVANVTYTSTGHGSQRRHGMAAVGPPGPSSSSADPAISPDHYAGAGAAASAARVPADAVQLQGTTYGSAACGVGSGAGHGNSLEQLPARVQPWVGEERVVVHGSYGSKVEAVVRRVVHLLSQDAAARILVFSSWADALDIISHALSANGVQHVLARGRKGFAAALETFQSHAAAAAAAGSADAALQLEQQEAPGVAGNGELDGLDTYEAALVDDKNVQETAQQGQQQVEMEATHVPGSIMAVSEGSLQQHQQQGQAAATGAASVDGSKLGQQGQQGRQASAGSARPGAGTGPSSAVRVLLLLVSQGSMGLNLLEAQHVVMVEPLLDPALEAQAIGRVHRFGQTHETHVHRFVVEHSIEENVAHMSAKRTADMDLAAAAPAGVRGGAGGSGREQSGLSVCDVAALLSTRWQEEGLDPGAVVTLDA